MIELNQINNYLLNVITKNNDISKLIGDNEFGHTSGAKIEKWVYEKLGENDCFKTWQPHNYLNTLFLLHQKGKLDHVEILNNTWWANLLIFGQPKPNGRYIKSQQEGADILLYDGRRENEIKKIHLINVKSHQIERSSRAPNIISALRLLRFFNYILSHTKKREFLENMSYWFVSISYKNGKIEEIHTKNLFLLDVKKIKMINFDAAIQIQWHVKDMIEKQDQPKSQFIKELLTRVCKEWESHKKSKNIVFENLRKNINRSLDSI